MRLSVITIFYCFCESFPIQEVVHAGIRVRSDNPKLFFS